MNRFIALLLLSLVSCGGGFGGSISRENYTSESFKAVCAHFANCGITGSQSACVQFYDSILGSYSSTTDVYGKAIELGKIKYDGAAASRCLNGYATASCSLSALSAVSGDCRSVYVGQVPVGQSCGNGECVPSAYCTVEVDGKCPGTCKDRVPAGQAATSPSQCAVGLVLISGTCSQPPGQGSSCGTGTGTSSVCAAGLTCSSDTKTCTTPKLVGDTCSSTAPCDLFYSCINDKCAAPAGVGASCGQMGTGTLSCKLELYCDPTLKTCAARLGEGATCTGSECNYDLRCGKANAAATGNTCHKPFALNQACSASASKDCASGLYCDATSKTCLAQLAAGAACTAFDSCTGGYCSANKCVSYVTAACF